MQYPANQTDLNRVSLKSYTYKRVGFPAVENRGFLNLHPDSTVWERSLTRYTEKQSGTRAFWTAPEISTSLLGVEVGGGRTREYWGIFTEIAGRTRHVFL